MNVGRCLEVVRERRHSGGRQADHAARRVDRKQRSRAGEHVRQNRERERFRVDVAGIHTTQRVGGRPVLRIGERVARPGIRISTNRIAGLRHEHRNVVHARHIERDPVRSRVEIDPAVGCAAVVLNLERERGIPTPKPVRSRTEPKAPDLGHGNQVSRKHAHAAKRQRSNKRNSRQPHSLETIGRTVVRIREPKLCRNERVARVLEKRDRPVRPSRSLIDNQRWWRRRRHVIICDRANARGVADLPSLGIRQCDLEGLVRLDKRILEDGHEDCLRCLVRAERQNARRGRVVLSRNRGEVRRRKLHRRLPGKRTRPRHRECGKARRLTDTHVVYRKRGQRLTVLRVIFILVRVIFILVRVIFILVRVAALTG